jgi:zinc protease
MRKAVVLSFLILCIQSISAQGKKATQTTTLPTFVTSVEGVKEYTLANGLQILLVPDASINNIVVNVVYHVGSRQEGYGETV